MAMSPKLRAAFEGEMSLAVTLYKKADYTAAFTHLERAHILGQRHYIPHVRGHFWMLKEGFKRRDMREIVGQIIRIIGSAGSLIGKVPVGNTGGANVSPIKPMPIPADLATFFEEE